MISLIALIALLPVVVAAVSLLVIFGGAKRRTGDRPLIHL